MDCIDVNTVGYLGIHHKALLKTFILQSQEDRRGRESS